MREHQTQKLPMNRHNETETWNPGNSCKLYLKLQTQQTKIKPRKPENRITENQKRRYQIKMQNYEHYVQTNIYIFIYLFIYLFFLDDCKVERLLSST